MGRTFLSHLGRNCGGNIVIDVSTNAKLVAPSFVVNTGGLGRLVLDIQIEPGGNLHPKFQCTKCGLIMEDDELGTVLSATCQICGHTYPVSELSVHHQIPCLCADCITGIRNPERLPKEHPALNYISAFGLAKGMKVVSLVKVLTSPIEL